MSFNQVLKIKQSAVIGLGLLLGALWSVSATARTYPEQYGAQQNNTYVTVYEECGFRGNSRALAAGGYADVRNLNIRNDSISSVQVPKGARLTMYKHENFKGEAVYLDRDVTCLDKHWNDEASSFKVDIVQQQPYEPKFYPTATPNNPLINPNRQNLNVDMVNLSKVVFANMALEKIADKEWQITGQYGNVDKFYETARVGRAIYLQKRPGLQSLQIDLNSNRLVFQVPNGQPVSHQINRLEVRSFRDINNQGVNRITPIREQRALIHGGCFNYRAYTRGGQGGIRFHGHEGFHQFRKGGYRGKVCHEGALTMELDKTELSTTLIVEIEGKEFRFDKNEKEDLLLNNWYRKKVPLKVVNY